MQRSMLLCATLVLALAGCASGPQTQADTATDLDTANLTRLDTVLAGDWRSPENTARDVYRHPRETLAFFGVRPEQTVIEITPGAGWYMEILAPYLREDGQYVAAIVDPAALPEGRGRTYQQTQRANLDKRIADAPTRFDRTRIAAYDPAAPRFGPDGSADVVLTFRNVHNWRGAGQAEGMFKGFYDVLRSGGVLGVVEHRAANDVPADDRSGYVGQAQVIAMAQAAGFRVDASSEINANPRDTKDHPKGVWMLPPGNNHEPADAARYQAIGESDRMTLRFVKP
ncbi:MULTISPECIES: class I SAM-dependent methyltransferase [Luteimonas]|uniref:class I SAM-dependent methyltransferase n=1 Tax=Luteimonas TaxID=83614 RepID=UPI000C7B342F|nr:MULTISPECIES: class I SAM-dependent methyltransferase [Luteimonas]